MPKGFYQCEALLSKPIHPSLAAQLTCRWLGPIAPLLKNWRTKLRRKPALLAFFNQGEAGQPSPMALADALEALVSIVPVGNARCMELSPIGEKYRVPGRVLGL